MRITNRKPQIPNRNRCGSVRAAGMLTIYLTYDRNFAEYCLRRYGLFLGEIKIMGQKFIPGVPVVKNVYSQNFQFKFRKIAKFSIQKFSNILLFLE